MLLDTLGLRSDPCCINVPMVNQKLLASEKSFRRLTNGCCSTDSAKWCGLFMSWWQ